MLVKISTILECSRIYSLPMTIASWLVIFTFSVLKSGNALLGILALIGICLAHLATNVLDDYFDYKSLIKQVGFNKYEYLKNTQKTKCRYLVSGVMRERDVLSVAAVYLVLAGVIGLIFYCIYGKEILYFILTGGVIVLLYSPLSKIRLSEILVGIAYGPLLFSGVYYAMSGSFDLKTFVLALPTMFITVVLLYIHTVMDFDFDINEGKKTLANMFNSQLDALVVLKVLLILAYLSILMLCIFDIVDWQIFFVYLTILLALDLYDSMFEFSINNSSVPERKWFHFPMENMQRIKKMNAEAFMIRMYQSRNLMIYFSLIMSIALIFGIT